MLHSNYFKEIILSKNLYTTDLANYTGISLKKIDAVLEGTEFFDTDEIYLLDLRIIKQNCSCIRTNLDVTNQIFNVIGSE